jgi:hypothetical protein
MGSVPRRAKRLESVISIFLLAVLILTGIGIFIQQSKYDMSRFGTSAPVLPKPEAQSPKAETAPESSPFAPAGFETLSKAESYNADNLYEKIDGKAPLYLEAGFKGLTTQRFASMSNKELWMEVYIYDMGDIKNGFSVYSVQKREGAEAFPSMRFAYKTGNALYFVHGKYYVEIVGSSETEVLSKAMAEAAQKITANLAAGANASIAELAFFPSAFDKSTADKQQNLIADSFKLYLASAFGFEGLTNVFTARYKIGEESVTAFISKRADSKEAEATAERYRKFLTENGAVTKNTDNQTFVNKVMDLYGATEIVFTTGPFVGGIHEAESQEAAESIAEMLLNRLNEFVIASNNERRSK